MFGSTRVRKGANCSLRDEDVLTKFGREEQSIIMAEGC